MPQRNESDGIDGVATVVGRLRDEILLERRSTVENGGIDVGKRCDGMPELEDDQRDQPLDDEEVCLDLGEPSPEVIDYARRELGETDDVKCRTLQELRDMIYGNWRGSLLSLSLSLLVNDKRERERGGYLFLGK